MAITRPENRPTVLTTPRLRLDLKEVDLLIATLRQARGRTTSDLDDLDWLHGRRRYILALLASRRAQRGRKIVRLAQWRNGGLSTHTNARYVA